MTTKPTGFTLIELLVVVLIIGILMALLFPAIASVLDSGKKAQAKNDVVQLATAVVAYEAEYGRLPDTNSSAADVGGVWLLTLMGDTNNSNAASLNPRRIDFITIPAKKNGKSGIDSNGIFRDPWNNPYRVAFDHDYDNRIQSAGDSPNSLTGSNLVKKVAIWNTNGNARRRVASWE